MDEDQASSGWLVCLALAVGVHAALLAPLILGREGSDGVAPAGGGTGATEPVMVVDSLVFAPVAEATTQMPARDVPETGAVQTPSPAPATAAPGPGRGATLLPFDVLPIPSPAPPPPAKKAATPPKAATTADAARPPPSRPRQAARPSPPEPQPDDVAAYAPGPPPIFWSPPPPPSPPLPPNRRSSRAFWFGVWCGRYVSCD
jgi:hypothetical protein